ncbi:MAG: hypothetical protein QF464_06005 [Myxococcota bacterium]|jgi:hypothetical protein|nr:hypothetical protein [Myxococcota bacterium]
MRITLLSVLVAGLFLAMGCQKPSPDAGPGPAPAKEAAKTPPAPAEQTATAVESALRMAKHPFKRADVAVTDAQLETIVASGYEAFESTADPRVRVFVFHYDAQELVKPAKVARWINQSGLLHNGQTSANRLRVVVAGTPEPGAVDEETSQVIDAFMDAFMVMR